MFKHHEGFFRNERNQRLFCQKWENPRAKATVVITHGQGEHSGCYEEFVQAFRADDLNFIAWDLAGHGRSEGLRGHAERFDDYVTDFYKFQSEIQDSNWLKGPTIYLAHSMGCLIQLLAFTDRVELQQKPTEALVFSSPLWGLSLPVPTYKQQGAQLISQILPELTLGNEIRNSQLTRDPEMIRKFESDPFRHQKISSTVYLGFLQKFTDLRARAQMISIKNLVLCSDNDPVVSTVEAREISSLLPHQPNYIEYQGAKHELFNDIHREDVYADLRLFFKSVLG